MWTPFDMISLFNPIPNLSKTLAMNRHSDWASYSHDRVNTLGLKRKAHSNQVGLMWKIESYLFLKVNWQDWFRCCFCTLLFCVLFSAKVLRFDSLTKGFIEILMIFLDINCQICIKMDIKILLLCSINAPFWSLLITFR